MTVVVDPLLHLVQRVYGDWWYIRRTERLWIATTRKTGMNHGPTLIETDFEEFVRLLENPPARVGRPLLSGDRGCSQDGPLGDIAADPKKGSPSSE